MPPTYCSDIHVFSGWSSNKEIYADATLHHFACELSVARVFGLKQFLLSLDTV